MCSLLLSCTSRLKEPCLARVPVIRWRLCSSSACGIWSAMSGLARKARAERNRGSNTVGNWQQGYRSCSFPLCGECLLQALSLMVLRLLDAYFMDKAQILVFSKHPRTPRALAQGPCVRWTLYATGSYPSDTPDFVSHFLPTILSAPKCRERCGSFDL